MEIPNLNYIDNLSGEDIEFKFKIIEILKKEISIEKEIYLNSIQSLDYIKTAEIVHKLKHKISMIGLEKDYIVAENYEINLKKQAIFLKNDFEEVLQKMENYIISL
jgi:hypothetical protein